MNRMLDAGEQLFYEGGSPALTLEAVIERAETSTGSFYARFGDMRGFLDAMLDRFVARPFVGFFRKLDAMDSAVSRIIEGVPPAPEPPRKDRP